jgi:hypothetical protein
VRPYRAALIIIGLGLVTFGVVFTLLQVTRFDAAGGPVASVAFTPTPDTDISAGSADSLAAQLSPGQAAVGVPIAGSEPLLRDLLAGDHVDVLASAPSPRDGRPMTAVVVRGALVLRPATSSDPLLLAVPSDDAIVLAHLVLGGTRLGYAVWPANGASQPEPQPMDEHTAQALLGLPVVASPTEAPARSAERTATPAPVAPQAAAQTAAPAPPAPEARPVGGFLYQAQAGDTWEMVAATFNLSAGELRQWNEAPPEASLDQGTLLFIPRKGSG